MTGDAPIDRLIQMLAGAPDALSLTIEQQRRATDLLARTNPAAGTVSCDYAEAGGMRGAWIEVEESLANRAIVYVHGGAFVAGSITSHLPLMATLARHARARVYAVDYRLAPEAPYPAGLEDCISALEGVSDLSTVHRLAVAGDSAGASLALAALTEIGGNGARGCDAVVLFSPWTDLTCTAASYETLRERDPVLSREFLRKMADLYLGGADPADPGVSPQFGDLAGLPPTLIQVGTRDVLYDDSVALDRAASKAGVDSSLDVWPEMIHVWQGFLSLLPEAERALSRAGDFLESVWDDSREAGLRSEPGRS